MDVLDTWHYLTTLDNDVLRDVWASLACRDKRVRNWLEELCQCTVDDGVERACASITAEFGQTCLTNEDFWSSCMHTSAYPCIQRSEFHRSRAIWLLTSQMGVAANSDTMIAAVMCALKAKASWGVCAMILEFVPEAALQAKLVDLLEAAVVTGATTTCYSA